ncbi:hypothetical protein [Roseibium denhamense]|uniref:Uncharacterized protein n=1 Tax=Roseibium denhamense TaxID=76305 RepID=A0ABY1PC80_9HYPH|nr:hypothetical protein [Roseibium denhamense]SMP31052.1 hypothetical protein SAMN06265374_3361 [Roseibium denhamense]
MSDVSWLFFALLSWVLAQSIAIGGFIGIETVVVIMFLGPRFGFWWVLGIAAIERVCYSYFRNSHQPFYIILFSVLLIFIIWIYVYFGPGHPANKSKLFSWSIIMDFGFPALAPLAVYLARNSDRPRIVN